MMMKMENLMKKMCKCMNSSWLNNNNNKKVNSNHLNSKRVIQRRQHHLHLFSNRMMNMTMKRNSIWMISIQIFWEQLKKWELRHKSYSDSWRSKWRKRRKEVDLIWMKMRSRIIHRERLKQGWSYWDRSHQVHHICYIVIERKNHWLMRKKTHKEIMIWALKELIQLLILRSWRSREWK